MGASTPGDRRAFGYRHRGDDAWNCRGCLAVAAGRGKLLRVRGSSQSRRGQLRGSRRQRRIANDNYEEAKAQRKIAEAQTAEAQAQTRKLERQNYVALVSIAQRETEANNVELSNRILDRCPPHLRGWEWYYCHRSNHEELAETRSTGRDYTALAVMAPDGKRFGCFAGKEAWIRDERGKELCAMRGHTGNIEAIAWSPDGGTIATGCRDREIRLWNAKDGSALGVLKGHGIWVVALRFCPNGRRLLSGAAADPLVPGRRTEVKIWDLDKRSEIKTLLTYSGGGVSSLAVSADGRRLAAGTHGGGCHLWNGETLELIREYRYEPHQGRINSLAFSPDGQVLASGSQAGIITFWDVESGRQIRQLTGHVAAPMALRFTADGQRLVSGGWDSTLRFWDVKSGAQRVLLRGHTSVINGIDFDATGSRVYTSSYDGRTLTWDATLDAHPATVYGHSGWTNTVAFHPAGKTFASGGWGGIILWDAPSGRRLGRFGSSHQGGPSALTYSPDGQRIAVTGLGPAVQLFEASTGRLVQALKTGPGESRSPVFTPDGSRLIVGDSHGNVRVWDLSAGTERKTLRAFEEKITGISPGPTAAGSSLPRHLDRARVFDLESAQQLLEIPSSWSQADQWTTAVFDRSGTRVAVLGAEHAIQIVNASSGFVVGTLAGHSAEIDSLAFSPDGRRLASGGRDRTVRVWDPVRAEEMLTLRAEFGEVATVVWSPDGRYLAAVGAGGGRVWDAGPPPEAKPDSSPVPTPAASEMQAAHRDFLVPGSKNLERLATCPTARRSPSPARTDRSASGTPRRTWNGPY